MSICFFYFCHIYFKHVCFRYISVFYFFALTFMLLCVINDINNFVNIEALCNLRMYRADDDDAENRGVL